DLIAKSLQDKGCVFYGCGPVQGKNNTYTFVEQWQSMADLELHAQQPHFIDASTKLSDILSAELDINVVNLL
ncbi:MAG TPA: antibiotic biosynthesis monooxygenase, partial [Pasteurellaceae bacterium]|nr:antibiotic biosynthesis monooxygenase [Pasteurellaceae bacterium]